jgi:predicted MFS family arabinose efflux permease
MPLRLLRNRDRAGALVIMLAVGTVTSGVFFFVNLLVQELWGYSPLKAGLAFLPMTGVLVAGSVAAARLVPRIGARPLLLTGAAAVAGGLFWLSQMTQGGTYAGQLLWPMLTTGAGLGLLFVPLSLVALARVADADSGIASSLLNAARQVGAAIGLAILGTVAWTVVADNARAHAGTTRAASLHAAYQQALLVGFDRAFLVAAGIALLILVVAIAVIRIRRADLSGS